jgi:hypothetical protein|tara:strand:- start:55679 stop:56095 length:417 start_codon:yes stop_codon:yes gene_type:complete
MSEKEEYNYDHVKRHSSDMKDLLQALALRKMFDPTEDVADQAMRYNDGKMSWELVDFKSLEPMVEVLMFGASKYSPNNWKKGQPTSEILGSLLRHLIAYQDGETVDPESNKHHLGHAMCNLMFLVYNNKNHPHLDDRK